MNDILIAFVCGSLIFAGGFAAGYAIAEERANQRAVLGRHRDSLARCNPFAHEKENQWT